MNQTKVVRGISTETLHSRNGAYATPSSSSRSSSRGSGLSPLISDSSIRDNTFSTQQDHYVQQTGRSAQLRNAGPDHKKRKSLSDEYHVDEDDAAASDSVGMQVLPLANITELVIVCGHAICTDSRYSLSMAERPSICPLTLRVQTRV